VNEAVRCAGLAVTCDLVFQTTTRAVNPNGGANRDRTSARRRRGAARYGTAINSARAHPKGRYALCRGAGVGQGIAVRGAGIADRVAVQSSLPH